MSWSDKLAEYDKIISLAGKFERKGKNMPYTSVNGHMFSQLNKACEIGIRLSEEDGKAFIEEYGSVTYTSYGSLMKGYVLIPEDLLKEPEKVAEYLLKGYEYVRTLPPK